MNRNDSERVGGVEYLIYLLIFESSFFVGRKLVPINAGTMNSARVKSISLNRRDNADRGKQDGVLTKKLRNVLGTTMKNGDTRKRNTHRRDDTRRLACVSPRLADGPNVQLPLFKRYSSRK